MAPNIVALDRLKAQLLTSGLSQRNNALFQVIDQLIDFLRQTINTTQAQITSITPATPSGGTTIITGGFQISNDGEDGEDGRIIPGPPGPQGPPGIVGPRGIDGEDAEDCCMPFVGNSIYDGVTTFGDFKQMM